MDFLLDTLINSEVQRQDTVVELIASENFVSDRIKRIVGSCLTNKYAEGYPGNRYYGGCEFVDSIETYCQNTWRQVFDTNYWVNVQPHSGSNANLAAYMAVLKPGDTVLSMSLENGGHLTHGSPVNISGKLFNFVHYGVDEEGFIDFDDFKERLYRYKPKLVVVGASSYSRMLSYRTFKQQIEIYESETGNTCYMMVDMAHVAGLIAAGFHSTPFGVADIVTTTTHKTLRGPRGGMIFCRPSLAKKIDSAIFPGVQGGPLMHVIAGKAACAEECMEDSYKKYIRQVICNAKFMAQQFTNCGFSVVTGGTDNHMFLIDLSKTHPKLTGKMVQEALDNCGITVNKNTVPGEKRSPIQASGIRIGTAAMTTRGWKELEFYDCTKKIVKCINQLHGE